jgi:hypothetical protein
MNNGTKNPNKFGGTKINSEDKISDHNYDHNNKNLLKMYTHEIRNMKLLNREMIRNIRNMCDEDKMDIILTLNHTMGAMKDLIDNI